MLNVKEIAGWQVQLNKMNPNSITEEYAKTKEVLARYVDLMTPSQYSEFLGHLQTAGISAREAMTQKEARELVAKLNKDMGYSV